MTITATDVDDADRDPRSLIEYYFKSLALYLSRSVSIRWKSKQNVKKSANTPAKNRIMTNWNLIRNRSHAMHNLMGKWMTYKCIFCVPFQQINKCRTPSNLIRVSTFVCSNREYSHHTFCLNRIDTELHSWIHEMVGKDRINLGKTSTK